MDLEKHTFGFMKIAKIKRHIKVFDNSSGKEITNFIAIFLEVKDFKGEFFEDDFYSEILPKLILSYHAFGNKVMLELNGIKGESKCKDDGRIVKL